MSADSPVSFNDVIEAHQRIASHIHRTPVLTCRAIDQRIGTRVYLKCENLQKTGAFKFRGAMNALLQFDPAQRSQGVVTHSSGNHAGAISAAANRLGMNAYIVMPSNSTEAKKSAVREYGGQITECKPTTVDREKVAAEIQQETGATLIPPFDHPDVIAGQGTCAKEFLRQVSYLDVIVSPVGGGGLMSGTCLASRAIRPDMTIWGAEPTGADDAYQSKLTGTLVPQNNPQTICDGLRTGLGKLTWPIVRDQVDEIIVADDEHTADMMRYCWERAKLIIEPSCAVVLAALENRLKDQANPPAHVGVIIGGGNVDLDNLPWN